MAGTYTAIMPNGERIRLEHWVMNSFNRGQLRDRVLLQQVRDAVQIYDPCTGHDVTPSTAQRQAPVCSR